jgi:hypothetical protein
MIRIPNAYTPARWRNTTTCDGTSIGIGFETKKGKVLLKLDTKSAEALCETLASYLAQSGICSQSARSSEAL